MNDGLLHRQPLRQRVLAGDDDVHVMPTAQAMIEHRQEAIGVRRQIDPNDVRLLVDHVIEEAGVLMGEAIVVLLPDVRGEQVVQRCDLAAPGQFERDFQPFRMLAEHGINDANKGLITVEQAVSPRQKITLEPPFALMFAEHGVQDAALRREKFIVVHFAGVPLTIGDFEDIAKQVRKRLVRTEDAEVALVLVEAGYVAQEFAEHQGVLCAHRAWRRDRDRVVAKVRHLQIAQKNPTVGVRVGAHATGAFRRELGEFGFQRSVRIEEFFRPVALHPAFQQLDMVGMRGVDEQGNLMRPKRAFDLQAVDDLRPGPALWAISGRSSATAAARGLCFLARSSGSHGSG